VRVFFFSNQYALNFLILSIFTHPNSMSGWNKQFQDEKSKKHHRKKQKVL